MLSLTPKYSYVKHSITYPCLTRNRHTKTNSPVRVETESGSFYNCFMRNA